MKPRPVVDIDHARVCGDDNHWPVRVLGADKRRHQFVDTLVGRGVQDSHASRYGHGLWRPCCPSKTIVTSASARTAKATSPWINLSVPSSEDSSE